MSILVTGGTGLLGTRLLKRMVASGLNCRAIVRAGKSLPTGVDPVEADLLRPQSLKAAVEGVSAVVHLAAALRTPEPDDIWKTNLDGTQNLIAATKQYAPDARIIMASTGLVYNADSAHPACEDDAVDPQKPYPASKVAAENKLRESGLTWAILRLGFVYGDQDGHLQSIPKLADMFKWHPANKLSLVHHRDVDTAINLALTGAMDGQIVNIVDEAPMSVYEITRLIGGSMQPSAAPLANPWFGQLDGTRARNLGFQPAVSSLHQSHRDGTL
ncbi:NAD-dependent epimerase/dehydratase family protein [Thalassospira lohafexi]|uniref:Epimerase n=1 Tax=Thalassospira lohafexi TaxID=744227 RepID=A0A2N3LC21_9PROT|nr:NAD(P)-dependent oxidoreductase [Thalassospira lohafexi]PKR60403.1 epimerase [Thalassospira lohafexi]